MLSLLSPTDLWFLVAVTIFTCIGTIFLLHIRIGIGVNINPILIIASIFSFAVFVLGWLVLAVFGIVGYFIVAIIFPAGITKAAKEITKKENRAKFVSQ